MVLAKQPGGGPGIKENAQQSRAVRSESGGPERKGTFGPSKRHFAVEPSDPDRMARNEGPFGPSEQTSKARPSDLDRTALR